MEKIILEDYEINRDTVALQPTTHTDYYTIVFERDQILHVKKTPLQLIKPACLEGGASYNGRREAVIYQTGTKSKVPIPISPRENIYAFPTHSPDNFECSWIFYHHVKSIKKDPKIPNQTIITFKNNNTLTLNLSFSSIEKQMQRTSQCIVGYLQKFVSMPLPSEYGGMFNFGWS
ncbi:competence protein ComK [Halalkalibacter lacteus]|uniref:competence protein ComK n=1 Tax=Halalkalibacter lacteus TaxID=3090663 RepID=UPI002FC8838C